MNALSVGSHDPRVITNVVDGVNRTQDDTHMWLAPFTAGRPHYVYISFEHCTAISVLRIWVHAFFKHITSTLEVKYTACLCGSLAVQCALSLKRLSAGPGFNSQTRQNKLFQDYWRACFEINFSDSQEGLTVSSIICDR